MSRKENNPTRLAVQSGTRWFLSFQHSSPSGVINCCMPTYSLSELHKKRTLRGAHILTWMRSRIPWEKCHQKSKSSKLSQFSREAPTNKKAPLLLKGIQLSWTFDRKRMHLQIKCHKVFLRRNLLGSTRCSKSHRLLQQLSKKPTLLQFLKIHSLSHIANLSILSLPTSLWPI